MAVQLFGNLKGLVLIEYDHHCGERRDIYWYCGDWDEEAVTVDMTTAEIYGHYPGWHSRPTLNATEFARHFGDEKLKQHPNPYHSIAANVEKQLRDYPGLLKERVCGRKGWATPKVRFVELMPCCQGNFIEESRNKYGEFIDLLYRDDISGNTERGDAAHLTIRDPSSLKDQLREPTEHMMDRYIVSF